MYTRTYPHTPTVAHTHSHTLTVPNSGLVLWCQQFCAMFLKRFYNSLRFWQAIIIQLILPLAFVLLGLIFAVTLPNANEDDPSRQLRIDNSVLDPNNRILFYTEFGNRPSGVFSFEVSECPVSSVRGFVSSVIMSSVHMMITSTNFRDTYVSCVYLLNVFASATSCTTKFADFIAQSEDSGAIQFLPWDRRHLQSLSA